MVFRAATTTVKRFVETGAFVLSVGRYAFFVFALTLSAILASMQVQHWGDAPWLLVCAISTLLHSAKRVRTARYPLVFAAWMLAISLPYSPALFSALVRSAVLPKMAAALCLGFFLCFALKGALIGVVIRQLSRLSPRFLATGVAFVIIEPLVELPFPFELLSLAADSPAIQGLICLLGNSGATFAVLALSCAISGFGIRSSLSRILVILMVLAKK